MFRFLAVVFLLAQFAKAAPRPNILFAIADDWGFGHAGAYGCKWVKTPAFDRVAREGILFTRAFTPNAKCAPSRAIILTGRYSWQLEEAANHQNIFPSKFGSYVEVLAANGYITGYTGKGWGLALPMMPLVRGEISQARCGLPKTKTTRTGHFQ